MVALSMVHCIFAASQSRLWEAKAKSELMWKKLCEEKEVAYPPQQILLQVFKSEKIVEVWYLKSDSYVLLKTYPICAASGGLGPKRGQGDNQVPEGVYKISSFNEYSNFYLSMKVSYPNKSDMILGNKDLGGDIYIHGSCESIGCIAITTPYIKELYWLTYQANKKNKVMVFIYPCRLSDFKHKILNYIRAGDDELINLWTDLKPIYNYFYANKTIPKIEINDKGRYLLAN